MTTRDELRQATHKKVESAAQKLFLEHGFRSTTVRDIAAAAGVSVGSVMSVGDKSALLVSMFDHSIAQVHEHRILGEGQMPQNTTVEARVDRLLDILKPFLSVFESQMDLAREYAAVLMSGGHTSVIFDQLAHRLLSEISVELANGGMDPNRIPAAARTIYLSYLGTLFVWAGSGATDCADAQNNLRSIFTFVVQSKDA